MSFINIALCIIVVIAIRNRHSWSSLHDPCIAPHHHIRLRIHRGKPALELLFNWASIDEAFVKAIKLKAVVVDLLGCATICVRRMVKRRPRRNSSHSHQPSRGYCCDQVEEEVSEHWSLSRPSKFSNASFPTLTFRYSSTFLSLFLQMIAVENELQLWLQGENLIGPSKFLRPMVSSRYWAALGFCWCHLLA